MIKKISELIAARIVFNTRLEEEREIYVYGLQIILNTLISIGVVLAAGYCSHVFYGTMFFLISYCSIRLYAGGLHASSNEKCMGIFIFGYLAIRFMLSRVEIVINFYSVLILCLINVFVVMWAPVEAYNNPIPEQKKYGMKRKAFFICLIITSVIFLVLYFKKEIGIWGYAGVCWFGIILVAGKIKNDFLRRKQL